MKISEIDLNLAVQSQIQADNLVWMDVRHTPFCLHGFFNPKQPSVFRRVPEDIAQSVSPGVAFLHTNTSGGRVRFKTNSPYIAICAEFPDVCEMGHMTQTGISGFDLYRYKEKQCLYAGTFSTPSGSVLGTQKRYEAILYTSLEGHSPCEMELCEFLINFPLYNSVNKLLIGLHSSCLIESGSAYSNENPVVFYGSSITQGGCASRPGNAYPAILSRHLNIDFINLGFSGCAKAEPAIARYMSRLKMQMFVSDYDHNSPDIEHLQLTHRSLYHTIREANPDLPYIIISRPDVDISEESQMRKEIIFKTYQTAVDDGDKNICFIDGATLFGKADREDCTVDGIHPNDFGFHRMANTIEDVLCEFL